MSDYRELFLDRNKLIKFHRKRQLYSAISLGVIFFIISSVFFYQRPIHAATTTWDMTTSGDYTFDSDKIEFSSGSAQLKAQYTPGTDWINTDSGNDWGYRRKITFDNTDGNLGVTSEDLINFPVLVKLNSERVDYSNTQDNGEDLRFTDSVGVTELKYEIETWNESGDSFVWVKIPQININSSTDYIYLYHGNSNASDGQDAGNVWDNCSMVYHMNESVGSGTVSDSSGNTSGTVSSGTVLGESGQISSSVNLSNSNGGVNLGDVGSPTLTSETTVSFWIYTTSFASPSRQNPFGQAYGGWGTMTIETSGAISWFFGSNGSNGSPYGSHPSSALMANGEWIYISAVRNPNGYTYKWYKNGGFLNGSTYSSTYPLIISRPFNIGDDYVNHINGKIDEFKVETSARTSAWIAASYKSQTDAYNTYDSQSILYDTQNPTLAPNTGQGYSSLSAFSQTLGSGSSGNIKYQISPDDGSTWYRYTGGNWVTTTAGYSETNTATDINTNISDFSSIGSNPKTLKWKAYLNSNGGEQPKLDSLSLTYVWDTAEPDNPTAETTTVKSQEGGDTLTTDTWYNYPNPYISWTEPSDYANPGETISGIAGYYLYFGTDSTADPHTAGSYQTESSYTASSLSSGSTYYLRIETADNAGNINHIAAPDPSLFIYKYDGIAPTSPVYVSVSPSGYTRTNSFTFSWPTSGGNAASDTGGSGLAGYQYKINSGSWSDTITGGSIEINDQANQGVNVFYFRAVDNALNVDLTPVQTNFYFNDTAPTCPTNLDVDPDSSDTNSFTFSWDEPIGSPEVAGYYYSINQLPTISNASFTEGESIGPDSYATQQGENTFYIVTKDNAGNYDLDSCNSITGNPTIDSCARIIFTANTSAPGVPTALQIFDISNRDLQEYATSLKWTAPTNQGTGFAGYEIYRSENGTNFTSVGTTSGTTYADTDLSSTLYYYYVKSRDNAGQYSAASSTVSITPTGKYTSPPVLTENPVSTAKSFSSTVTWETDREASSFVYTSTSQNGLNSAKAVGDPSKTTDHSIEVTGLEPETIYYYKTMWEDVDGNQGTSDTYNFTTGLRPRFQDVNVNNIGLNSATITWKSTTLSHSSINFGKSTSYGGTVDESGGGYGESHIGGLSALEDTTTYHFQINGVDIDGNKIVSDDYTFSTLTRPKIENLRFEPVKDAPTTTLKFTWQTNIPATSIVSYQPSGGSAKTRSDAEYRKVHEIIIDSLQDRTTYILIARGVDEYGNEAVSDTNTYTTPDDTRPPKVSDLNIEIKSSGIGSTQKAQIVVSWQTDEEATSQVEYGQGISGTDYSFKSKEDGTLTTNHAVIVSELDPSKIYHLRAVSKDSAGNIGNSQDTTTITGKSQNSIIDIIINSLEQSLGWLFRLFG